MKDTYENDELPSVGKVVAYVVGVIFALMVLGWFTMGNDFFMYKFFAPRQEAVRREVYEETYSYKQGMVQTLNSRCLEAKNADDNGKSLVYQVINQEFAKWDSSDTPDYLRECLATARDQAK